MRDIIPRLLPAAERAAITEREHYEVIVREDYSHGAPFTRKEAIPSADVPALEAHIAALEALLREAADRASVEQRWFGTYVLACPFCHHFSDQWTAIQHTRDCLVSRIRTALGESDG